MVLRPVVVAVICVGLFLIFETLVPKAKALKTSNINDFRLEDQRTLKRRNYMLQRAMDKGTLDNVGVTYDIEPADAAPNPDELSAFIVDYANMIDDVILLDKSVETRTRKRGNIKLEKYNNQALSDPPCSCKSIADTQEFGKYTFPRRIDKRICDKRQERGCDQPYICKEIVYNVAVLKKRTFSTANYSLRNELIPGNLNLSWYADFEPISVGCECQRDYSFRN